MVNFDGACAASPQPVILARGVRFSSLSLEGETRTSADAPSEMGDALAAVTVPVLGMKTGRTVLSLSAFNYICSV